MATKTQEKKQAIKDLLASKGWEEDRFGHMHKTMESGRKFRYKFGRGALRQEFQSVYSDGRKEWRRRCSGAYGNLSITEEGLIAGLKG